MDVSKLEDLPLGYLEVVTPMGESQATNIEQPVLTPGTTAGEPIESFEVPDLNRMIHHADARTPTPPSEDEDGNRYEMDLSE